MDLSSYPALDQHAHNVFRPEVAECYPLAAGFTESHDRGFIEAHAQYTLCYRRSLRDVAELLGCADTEQAVEENRRELGWEELTRRCLQAANLEAIFLDDGFVPDEILPVEWHGQFVGVRRLLRVEFLAETLLGKCDSFAEFVDRFRAALETTSPDVVGFKSIAAYRSGLAIQSTDPVQAAERFAQLQANTRGERVRLVDKILIDFLFQQTLEVAAQKNLPIQLHTGFGDPDLNLRLANPLHLRTILENPAYRQVPIVLLHASYPFVREAGYLASVYSQVYLDMGLAIPLLSVRGMRETVAQLLELTPMTKVLYSSDAHFFPELYYVAARWGRKILGSLLDEAIRDGDLNTSEAEWAARHILAENARQLYRWA